MAAKENLVLWLKKKSDFVSDRLCVSLVDRRPAAFHSLMLHGLLFSALVLQPEEPSWGTGLTPLRKNNLGSQDIPPHPWLAAHGSWASPSCDLTLPTCLEVVSALSC